MDIHFRWFPILTLAVIMLALTIACALSQGGLQPTMRVTPGGGATIQVSTGVILVTPGQPVPLDYLGFIPVTTANSPGGNTPAASPSSAATPDLTSFGLPDGVTIYPQAYNLVSSAQNGGMQGVNYVQFDTSAGSDLILEYYRKQLSNAGWHPSLPAIPTADPIGKNVWGWTRNGVLLSITSKLNTDGTTQVLLSWLKLN